MGGNSEGDHGFIGGRGRVERERGTRSGWELSGTEHGVRSEDNVAVIGEVRGLLGVELTDVQRQLNAPLQQGLLDAGSAHRRSPASVKVIQPRSNSLSM